jgi:acyl dehydratase
MTGVEDVARSAPESVVAPALDMTAMLGYEFRISEDYHVAREKIREYARAVQDCHPTHWCEDTAHKYGYPTLIAPLTFISIIGLMAQNELLERLLPGYDISQILQTGQALKFHRPLQVGDKLTCHVSLDSFRQAFGGDLITTKNVIRDQDREPVITAHTRLAGRIGSAAGEGRGITEAARTILRHERRWTYTGAVTELTPTRDTPVATVFGLGARALGSVAVGDELPTRVVELTRGDLVNYAGVVGDPNPIHWNAEIAALAGLEDVVAHGMLTMGLGAGFVTSWLGDPGAVREFDVRFTSPVYVAADRPGQIEYSGKVKSVDPGQQTAIVAVTAKHRDRSIFGRATAVVQLT